MESEKHAGGRPTVLTAAIRARIVLAIGQDHLPYNSACDAVGVSYDAFRDWMRRGEQAIAAGDDNEYSEFTKAVLSAKAARTADLVARIAASEDWRASAWLLERTQPDEFGKTRPDAPGGVTVNIHQHLQEVQILQSLLQRGMIAPDKMRIIEAEIIARHAERPSLADPADT